MNLTLSCSFQNGFMNAGIKIVLVLNLYPSELKTKQLELNYSPNALGLQQWLKIAVCEASEYGEICLLHSENLRGIPSCCVPEEMCSRDSFSTLCFRLANRSYSRKRMRKIQVLRCILALHRVQSTFLNFPSILNSFMVHLFAVYENAVTINDTDHKFTLIAQHVLYNWAKSYIKCNFYSSSWPLYTSSLKNTAH